jgi:phosphoenolpyruvate synthase/pyruvate phosphate dikinase
MLESVAFPMLDKSEGVEDISRTFSILGLLASLAKISNDSDTLNVLLVVALRSASLFSDLEIPEDLCREILESYKARRLHDDLLAHVSMGLYIE